MILSRRLLGQAPIIGAETLRHCVACDVKWKGLVLSECWMCGKPGEQSNSVGITNSNPITVPDVVLYPSEPEFEAPVLKTRIWSPAT